MEINNILKPCSREQLETLSRRDLIELLLGEQDLRAQAEGFARQVTEEIYELNGRYLRVKNRFFGSSSEKTPKPKLSPPEPKAPRKRAANKNLKPSERYPNVPVIDQDVLLDPPPNCKCCGEKMVDSGMRQTSEVLSVVPKKYIIKRQHSVKYRCTGCYGDMQTTPAPPRIKPGSSYDDNFIIDVAMSKYCDLIPIERYVAIARRENFPGLPAQSLIELTHYLADFLYCVYELIKVEVQSSKLLYADETPHKMLEGSDRKNWYLWGFSTDSASYFECHDTRSGDVAASFLLESKCVFLMSDVYSGYSKAVRECNNQRIEQGDELIESIYCNSHSRRKFKEISEDSGEGQYFVEQYQEIYKSEKENKQLPPSDRLDARAKLAPKFEEMNAACEELLERVSNKSFEASAAKYFIKNYDGLTKFLSDASLPIDNNHQERQMRNPVIGRKTWCGTHSKRGAKTAAILFSIVESCKLVGTNPRRYIKQLVTDIHNGKKPYTPRQASVDHHS